MFGLIFFFTKYLSVLQYCILTVIISSSRLIKVKRSPVLSDYIYLLLLFLSTFVLFSVLFDLVYCELLQTKVLSAWRKMLFSDTDNKNYILK